MKKYVCYVEEVTEEKFDEKVIKEESNAAMIFKSEEDEKSAMERLRGYIEFWK